MIVEIVVNSVSAEEHTITNLYGRLGQMNQGTRWASQSLRDTSTMPEVTQFQVGQFASMHGLVNPASIFFGHHLVLNQTTQKAVIGGQTAQWSLLWQEIDPAIANMGKKH